MIMPSVECYCNVTPQEANYPWGSFQTRTGLTISSQIKTPEEIFKKSYDAMFVIDLKLISWLLIIKFFFLIIIFEALHM